MSDTRDQSAGSREEGVPLILVEEGNGPAETPQTKPGMQVLDSLAHNLDHSEKKKSKAIEKAELQRALENMPVAAVSEADLHTVPWNDLCVEFLRNFLPGVIMIGLVYWLARVTPSSPIGGKLYMIPPAVVLLFLLVVFLIEVTVAWIRDPANGYPCGNRLWAATPLLQAMAGKWVLRLQSMHELYIFAHSIERRPNIPGVFVELVVSPDNVEAPRKIFRLCDQEIFPSRWKATGLQACNGDDYSEKLLQAAGGKGCPSLAQEVEEWIFAEKPLQLPCWLVLTPASIGFHVRALWDHWAIRVVTNAVVVSFFVNPIWSFLNTMLTLRAQYCFEKHTRVLPFCGPDESNRTCTEFCDSFVSFVSGVGGRIKVEEIEFIWTVCLASIVVFVISLAYVRKKHQDLETKFVLSMEGVSKEAAAEILQTRTLLEENLTLYGTLQGLRNQWKAYHSKLRACEPLTTDIFSGPAQNQNPCFMEITKHVRAVRMLQATHHPISLPISDLEHENTDVHGESRELVTWPEKIDSAKRQLTALKNLHDFSRKQSVQQKEFKFCVSVPVTCLESLELLKTDFFAKAGDQGYSDQLHALFNTKDCQDQPSATDQTPNFCHVTTDFRMGPLLIPAGVCLTHVACQMPSMEMLSLEVGKDKDISSREKFLLLFYGRDEPGLGSKVLERFSAEYQWPPIMLPSSVQKSGPTDAESQVCVDSQGLAANMKDTYIYQFYLIFQLSPQYFQLLRAQKKDADMSLYGFTEEILARLEKAPDALAPGQGPRLPYLQAIRKQSWQDAASSHFCLVAEADKAITSSKFFSLLSSLAHDVGVIVVCGCFAMIVPLFRYFRWRGEVFPEPFTKCLAFNSVFQFGGLVCYFWLFTTVAGRLDAAAEALSQFQSRTLAPAVPPATANGRGRHNSSGTPPALPAAQDDPFQLYIAEIREYRPDDHNWVSKWQKKEAIVMRWHLCARYLRIFVSGARLTAQAILVAAAVILVVMLLVDLAQGMRGYGALSVNNDVLLTKMHNEISSSLKSAISSQVTNIAKQAADAARTKAENQIVDNVHNSLDRPNSDRRLLDHGAAGAWGLDVAVQSLTNALEPLDSAVELIHQRQLFDLGQQLQQVGKVVSVGNIQDISQAQLLSICMILLLLFFSCYLLVRIARINDYMEKHESILVQAKEQHTQNQSERERRACEEERAVGGAGGRPGRRPSSGHPEPDDDPERAAKAVADAQASYERMLEASIESAHTNRARFPLKLFSFVITQGLLFVWLAAAVQPLVQEAWKVVPVFVGDFCRWIGSQDVVEQAQSALLNTTATVETAIFNGTKVSQESAQNSLFYSLVCTPLMEATKELGNTIHSDLEQAKNIHNYDRRLQTEDEWLQSQQAVVSLVEDWWDNTPGDPQAKLALVRLLVQERAKSARRLLAAGPTALQNALRSGALTPRRAGTGPSQWLSQGSDWPAASSAREL